jgi:hypothetical protein
MNTETSEPIIENITTPTARRIIVTYTAKVSAGNYSSFEAQTMMIIDLPPDTTPDSATTEAVTAWRDLHESYGDQFAQIATQPNDNWQSIETMPKAVQSLMTVVKTIWGNISPRLNRKG